ncbi:MAG: response regulator transcription factor, partial [Sphaerobacter sp.]|nr:response regulator transcription factor [Sphaerobacter sp.]
IIVVTQQRTTQDKVRAFTRGADDFVERPFDPPELVARISAVVRRCRRSESRLASTVLQVGSARLSMSHLTFQIDGQPPVRLTPTEMQLLALLMQSSMSPVSRSRLIERTWGIEFLHESNRVDVYIRRLREKIEPDPSSPIYVRTVRGVGYLFCPPEPGDLPLPGRDASPCSTAASH